VNEVTLSLVTQNITQLFSSNCSTCYFKQAKVTSITCGPTFVHEKLVVPKEHKLQAGRYKLSSLYRTAF